MAIGVSYEIFWHLNPRKLNPFYEAFKMRRKMEDEKAWMFWGVYGQSVFETVMARFGAGLAGKSSQAKYIDKPIMQKVDLEEMTEEELNEKELQRMILAEELWIKNDKRRGLPETITK